MDKSNQSIKELTEKIVAHGEVLGNDGDNLGSQGPNDGAAKRGDVSGDTDGGDDGEGKGSGVDKDGDDSDGGDDKGKGGKGSGKETGEEKPEGEKPAGGGGGAPSIPSPPSGGDSKNDSSKVSGQNDAKPKDLNAPNNTPKSKEDPPVQVTTLPKPEATPPSIAAKLFNIPDSSEKQDRSGSSGRAPPFTTKTNSQSPTSAGGIPMSISSGLSSKSAAFGENSAEVAVKSLMNDMQTSLGMGDSGGGGSSGGSGSSFGDSDARSGKSSKKGDDLGEQNDLSLDKITTKETESEERNPASEPTQKGTKVPGEVTLFRRVHSAHNSCLRRGCVILTIEANLGR